RDRDAGGPSGQSDARGALCDRDAGLRAGQPAPRGPGVEPRSGTLPGEGEQGAPDTRREIGAASPRSLRSAAGGTGEGSRCVFSVREPARAPAFEGGLLEDHRSLRPGGGGYDANYSPPGAALVRDAPARAGRRFALDPAHAGSQRHLDHSNLHARPEGTLETGLPRSPSASLRSLESRLAVCLTSLPATTDRQRNMSDYNFLMESRLSPEQVRVVGQVSRIALEQGLNVYLVGGAVRDLTAGQSMVCDLVFVVEGSPQKIHRHLDAGHASPRAKGGGSLGTDSNRPGVESLVLDKRLNSAEVYFATGVRAAIADSRNEMSSKPGRPPEVRPAMIVDDLKAR